MSKPIIRSTLLRAAYESEALARWQLMGGGKESTKEMQLGTLAHAMLLEPKKAKEEFIQYAGTKAGREYKSLLKTMPAENLFPEEAWCKANEMAATVRDYLKQPECPKKLADLILKGKKEETLEYENEKNIFQIKPDSYTKNCFLDYKTTSTVFADYSYWSMHCQVYGLEIQLGYYAHVLKLLGNEPTGGAYHLVQSTQPPYCISVFFFQANTLNQSLEKVLETIDQVEYLLGTFPYIRALEIPQELEINWQLLKRGY